MFPSVIFQYDATPHSSYRASDTCAWALVPSSDVDIRTVYVQSKKAMYGTVPHPEGSMIEGYTTKKVIECCIGYLQDGKAIGLLVPRHKGRLSGRGTKRKKESSTMTTKQ